MRALLVLVALAGLLGLGAGQAAGQDEALTGTLRTVLGRGTLRLGVRTGSVPFAFTNPGGQPVGFSVDLCLGVAEDVARRLHRDLLLPDAPAWREGIRVEYVPVSAEARLAMVTSGAVDLECGSSTATAERGRVVAFSPVFFLAGTKLLTATAGGLGSVRDLVGKRVAMGKGTTNAEVMLRLAQRAPGFEVVQAEDVGAAFGMLEAGTVAAVASDDVLLAGMLASHHDRGRFRIVGDFLSFEPYALMLRRDDADMAGLVGGSFRRMASEGVQTARYRRWFMARLPDGETLGLPMSNQLAAMYAAMGAGE